MSGLAGHNHSRPAAANAGGPEIVTWANAVTALRLAAVPVTVWLTVRDDWMPAAGLFALAGLSDALDGWLARRQGGTALGAFLDPLADKALLVGMFLALAHGGDLPVWLVSLAIGRDVLIVAGLIVWRWRGIAVRFRPLAVSKLNTALQLLLVAVTLVVRAFGLPRGETVLDVLIAAVAASTLVSACAYLRVALR